MLNKNNTTYVVDKVVLIKKKIVHFYKFYIEVVFISLMYLKTTGINKV